jgi:hypothetical protein
MNMSQASEIECGRGGGGEHCRNEFALNRFPAIIGRSSEVDSYAFFCNQFIRLGFELPALDLKMTRDSVMLRLLCGDLFQDFLQVAHV